MPFPLTATVDVEIAALEHAASLGPNNWNVIVPVGLTPPLTVAVSLIVPPSVVPGDACVLKPGCAGRPHAVTLLVWRVTAPLRAKVPPLTLASVVRVMLVNARTFPANEVAVPRVAELPTCHQTPQAEAPLVSVIDEAVAVVSVVPIWKM